MKRWLRAWGSTLLAWALVMIIGGAAIAGSGGTAPSLPEQAADRAIEAVSDEAEKPETEATETEVTSEEAADNHGQCVSTWAHRAKEEGLERSAFGAFVSSVAQSDETGEDCDFAAQLEAALAEQEAATDQELESAPSVRGKSAEPHGNSADHKPAL